MGEFADTSVVELAWNRVVPDEAAEYVDYLIDKAERLVRAKVANLDTRLTDEAITNQDVQDVVVDMVLRLLRNPEGFSSESAGDYSYQRNAATGEGRIFMRADEVARLRGTSDGVTSVPVGDTALVHPHRRAWIWPDYWYETVSDDC